MVGTAVAAVAADSGKRLKALAFLATEFSLGFDQVRDVKSAGRSLRQRASARLDAVAILEAVEPACGDRVDAVVSAGHGAQDRAGRVGIPSEVNDVGYGFLEGVGRQ